jgi:hypothetical protein
MILSKGEKVFVITRRLFHGDLRRHFVGEVQKVSDLTMRVQGYAFIFDEPTSQFIRREDQRTRIFPLTDAGLVINVIPGDVTIADVLYKMNEQNQRVITDDKLFSINVDEFATNR